MTVLSDRDITMYNGIDFQITPFYEKQIQPASYDVKLGSKFKVFKPTDYERLIQPGRTDIESIMDLGKLEGEEFFILDPQKFALGVTEEYFRFGPTVAGRLEGKSSLGRLGLCIHATAGWFDPGFEGTGTIELFNMGPHSIILTPGMFIAQMSFLLMSSTVERPYGSEGMNSKYQRQIDPTASRS